MAQKGIVTRKTKVVLNYLEEKPEVFKLQQVVLPQIDFDTLVAEMANSCGIPAPQTEAVITGALNRIVHYMEIGHAVNLKKFGTFKPAIRTKVATKLEKLSLENIVQKYVRFIPGKQFRNMLANMGTEEAEVLDTVE